MTPHAFIAMPFGTKPGADGAPIDFNRICAELLKPALEAAGCEVFRADDEQRAGDIRTDMFQELLVADLVVADLTLDNPNVWYELGVRHALRARGVVLVQGPRPTSPFDIYTDRKLRYRLKDGAPDPAFLDADRALLTAMARATLNAASQRKVSPVYTLLPHLREPQWKQLLLADDNEFGAAYEQWRGRMEVARAKCRAGDILVLAAETPTQALWLEAKRDAGNALLKLRHFEFALEQFDDALSIDPTDGVSRCKGIVCLGRLGRHEEAHEAARKLVEDRPSDPEAWALAGRVGKERWVARWCVEGATTAQLRESAGIESASLEEAIEPYHQAFIAEPSHHYSGINALTLQLLLQHLGGEVPQVAVDNLIGGVLWAALSAGKRDPKDYWAKASYAELCLLVNPRESVVKEYRNTVAAAKAQADLKAADMHLLYNASSLPGALMNAASAGQDMACRILGDCRFGGPIDREFGAMVGGPNAAPNWTGAKLFGYARYDPDVSAAGLAALGLADIDAKAMQTMDSVDHMPDIQRVGRTFAQAHVTLDHLRGSI